MVAPRKLIIEACAWPDVTIPPGLGGAPGRLKLRSLRDVKQEVERAKSLTEGLEPKNWITLVPSGENGDGPFGTEALLTAFIQALSHGEAKLSPRGAIRP